VAISSILIGMMMGMGFGFDFLSSISWSPVTAECFCFVDDTDLCEAAPSVEHSGEAILPKVRQAMTWWSQAIRMTGGAIRPDKSFWWLIDFAWHEEKGEWKFRRRRDFHPSDLPGGLTSISVELADPDGTLVDLDWLEPDQAKRTLGVMMAPLSHPSAQLDAYREKALAWAAQIKPSVLLPYDVLPMIRSTIQKSLEYPMAMTTLRCRQWEQVMSPVLMAALPKAGFVRTFPRAVVYAPIAFQGIGVPHPFALQMTKHLDMLLRHPGNRTKSGVFLEAILQAHQLETGTAYGIFQQVYDNTAILASNTWVKRVWQSLDEYRVHLEFSSPGLELLRDGDRLLMDIFMDASVDQLSLKWLNWCREYLHVVTLSDLVTADGTQLTLDAWNGVRSHHRRDRYNWPRTSRPPNKWWTIWREWLSHTILNHNSHHRRLITPLGLWFEPDEHWKWKYSPEEKKLFHREGPGWIQATATDLTSRRRQTFALPSTLEWTQELPVDCVRASVSERPNPHLLLKQRVVQLLCHGRHTATQPSPPSSIHEFWSLKKSHSSPYYGWVPESIEIIGSEARLLIALRAGTLRVVSDGSYKLHVGAAAAQILTTDGQDVIWIKCQTPGAPEDQSSTRSELIGILSALMVLDWMSQLSGISRTTHPRPSIEAACDGLVALRKSFADKQLKPTTAQFDLSSTIREVLRLLPIHILARHVRAHMDTKAPHHQLDWWQQRNVEADAQAQSYRRMLESSGRSLAANPRFFCEPVALFLDGTKVSKLVPSRIMELVTLPPLKAYWTKKHRLTESSSDEVDWTALGRAMHSLEPRLQRWTAKHTVGMCGVGKFRVLWKFDTDGSCPRCQSCPMEDYLHVPRCRGPTAVAEWTKRHRALRDWMIANQTAPEIETFLFEYLKTVRTPSLGVPSVRIRSHHPSLFKEAIRSQASMGSQMLLEGLLSKEWCRLQELHYIRLGSLRSVRLWASRLIQHLISLGYYMWKDRNAVFHSEDNSRYSLRKQEVDLGIQEQYSLGPTDLPPYVCAMLRAPLSATLEAPLEARLQWLKLVTKERAISRRSLARQRQMMYELTHR
jgi:hypothetical protein